MNKRPRHISFTYRYFIGILFLFAGTSAIAQPEPCDVLNPEMTPTCAEACIICDIDGFTGRHESDIEGSLPDDFCTRRVHNAQWIAFQAASTNLRILLSVSNCQLGNGLELTMYQSSDCENFRMISNCRGAQTAVPEGTSAEFENTEPLVIGQFYYLAMDGNMADNCDWTLQVLEGSTEVSPLTDTPPIEGLDEFCAGVPQTFSIDPEVGSVLFDWFVNGILWETTEDPNLELILNNPNTYELCVQAKNACDEATPYCTEIEVITIPITELEDEFCAGECYEIDGYVFCESGTFEYDIALANGCDSTISISLTELPQPVENINVNICEGDTITIGATPYTNTGFFTDTLQTGQFCDSIVNLTLGVIICTIESEFISTSTTCFGDNDGSLSFQVNNGTPPFIYTWQHLSNTLTGVGEIETLSEEIVISDLPVGTVIIEVNDNYGNVDIIIAEVTQPSLIENTFVLSDFNGFNVRCAGDENGSVTTSPIGGIAPYDFSWSFGASSTIVSNLSAGSYVLTITDALGCELIEEVRIIEPNQLTADISFEDPTCVGLETGMITINNVNGGIGPYSNSLNDGERTNTINYEDLSPEKYTILIEDANGCLIEVSDILIAPQIPEINGTQTYSTLLGCETQIDTEINDIEVSQIVWQDGSYLNCTDCLDPIATPFDSEENLLIVTSVDNCSDSLSISISVDKNRQFYAPNIFNPNGQNIGNRTFCLVGNKEVLSINLSVYDRWGNLVFTQEDMSPNDCVNGWDGTIDNEPLETGVYVWLAEVFFIDGFSDTFSGDVTLVK